MIETETPIEHLLSRILKLEARATALEVRVSNLELGRLVDDHFETKDGPDEGMWKDRTHYTSEIPTVPGISQAMIDARKSLKRKDEK